MMETTSRPSTTSLASSRTFFPNLQSTDPRIELRFGLLLWVIELGFKYQVKNDITSK